ncbi:phage-like protein [Stenotrophomonas maltophilia]|nr:phage-like protein [Stenotrophomonas maltophilia]
MKMDSHDRIDLTGPWAGFGFQGGHMFTPEDHQLEPCDMAWWSLTCNNAREWRLMMAEAAPGTAAARRASATARSSVIYLAEALRIRRERRFGVGAPGSDAGASNVVYMSRGRGHASACEALS